MAPASVQCDGRELGITVANLCQARHSFGEEELLAAYLRDMNANRTDHVCIDIAPEEGLPDLVMFESGHFKALASDPGYQRKKEADRISYEWDALVERLLRNGDPSIHGRYVVQTSAQSEQGLRLMAAETRFRRRQLAESFIGALRRAEPGMRLGRLVYGGLANETVYMFVVAAKKATEAYDEYRQSRIGLLLPTCKRQGSRLRWGPPSSA